MTDEFGLEFADIYFSIKLPPIQIKPENEPFDVVELKKEQYAVTTMRRWCGCCKAMHTYYIRIDFSNFKKLVKTEEEKT